MYVVMLFGRFYFMIDTVAFIVTACLLSIYEGAYRVFLPVSSSLCWNKVHESLEENLATVLNCVMSQVVQEICFFVGISL